MRRLLILKCSPRAAGVSDTLADCFRIGANLPAREIALRDMRIAPCQNCGACAPPPHFCPLDESDDCREVFDAFDEAELVLFSAPIYFYALPAHFKAFIDRGQRIWQARAEKRRKVPALVLLAAGRPKGDKLFEGAIRTISWFLKALQTEIAASLCFRGLDNVGDLMARQEIGREIAAWARQWSRLNR